MISQTPWFERKFDFNFQVGLFPVIFSRLEGSIFRLYTLLSNADEEACRVRKKGWSVNEQVGHLCDLEPLWFKRMNDFIEQKTVLTAADLTNSRTENAGHNERPLKELVELFTTARQKMLEVVYDMDVTTLEKTSIHPRLQQPMRLVDALYFIAEHDDHHIAAISSQLRKPA